MKFGTRNILIFTLILCSLALSGTSVVKAQEQQSTEVSLAGLIEQIERLQTILEQRNSFGVAEPFFVEEEVSQYFFLRESAESEPQVYGSEASNIILETDGGVTQLFIQQNCSNTVFLVYEEQDNSICRSGIWLMAPSDDDGVVTFTIPVSYSQPSINDVELSVSVCRFNGCEEVKQVVVTYKDVKEFIDSVSVTNRYAYEYEYDDEVFLIQEFLIDLGGQSVRRIKAVIRCEDSSVRNRASEKQRVGCSENKKISRSLIDYDQTDDQGNVYDLLLEFTAEVTDVEFEQQITVELDFTDMSNRTHSLVHRIDIAL